MHRELPLCPSLPSLFVKVCLLLLMRSPTLAFEPSVPQSCSALLLFQAVEGSLAGLEVSQSESMRRLALHLTTTLTDAQSMLQVSLRTGSGQAGWQPNTLR
jgi:hypothetical protein